MSRILSINQSEPGLYLISVQRSHFTSVGTLLKSIADPPLVRVDKGTSHRARETRNEEDAAQPTRSSQRIDRRS